MKRSSTIVLMALGAGALVAYANSRERRCRPEVRPVVRPPAPAGAQPGSPAGTQPGVAHGTAAPIAPVAQPVAPQEKCGSSWWSRSGSGSSGWRSGSRSWGSGSWGKSGSPSHTTSRGGFGSTGRSFGGFGG